MSDAAQQVEGNPNPSPSGNGFQSWCTASIAVSNGSCQVGLPGNDLTTAPRESYGISALGLGLGSLPATVLLPIASQAHLCGRDILGSQGAQNSLR